MSDASEVNKEQRFSTDEMIDVLEHLRKDSEKTWSLHAAEHGLDPFKVKRAVASVFPEGEGKQRIAVEAFAWGLQFGAMRLAPFPYDQEAESPCQCILCQLRRAVENADEP